MVLERAEVHIKQELLDDTLQWLQTRGLALTGQFTGCQSFKVMRCVEHPERIMLLAEWQSIEAHLESRQEPAHVEFRETLRTRIAGSMPTVHFVEVKVV